MKQINNYILERLHITKDTQPTLDFKTIFKEGEECKFKDIDIYKTRSNKNIDDLLLHEQISKYFNDDDDVWVIHEKQQIPNMIGGIKNEEICYDLSMHKKGLMQKVYMVTGHCGFYIKDVPSINAICLMKKLFGFTVNCDETIYIFKFKN